MSCTNIGEFKCSSEYFGRTVYGGSSETKLHCAFIIMKEQVAQCINSFLTTTELYSTGIRYMNTHTIHVSASTC